MSKRLLILTCAVALISGACSNLPQADVNFGSGREFVPYVADHLDDAGMGNAVALDQDGIPYVSYFIFPAVLKAGAIPLPRPLGAPFITTGGDDSKDGAAVGVASVSADGIWTRGAAAQVIDSPSGITVPYDPDTVDGLIGATSDNTNGTDIAIDANGGKHVVWAGRDGIWYATGTTSFKGSATAIEEWTPPLAHSGPLGRPSVTVDDSAQPWVAYAIDTADGQEIRVATTEGGKWTTQTAASVERCSGCRQSGTAPIAVNADGPLVVYVDGDAGAVMAARLSGDTWSTETVQTGISPSGLSVAVDTNGTPWVAYYTGDGAVNVATTSGAAWTTSKVADAKPGDGTGTLAETTGVAVEDDGTVDVAWYDDGDKAVHLASGTGGASFKSIDTEGTQGGGFPSLAVTSDGSRVFLAWYDLGTQDLLLGVLGDAKDILVAQPSPTPEPAPPTSPTPAVECPKKTGIGLVAPSGAAVSGFSETTLTAPADTDFTICFDNQDPSVQHNVDVFDQQGGTSLAAGNVITGPAQELLDVTALKPGTYFYQCDIHPPTMTGTLTVK
ncbi:MAG: cupredoxin domain-containing protein [Actinomycetota bacterium]